MLAERRARSADPNTAPEQLREMSRDVRLAASVASNPAAPGDVLRALSDSWDADVLRAVVANANADLDTLLKLAHIFPVEFFANPVVPLLLFEQPTAVLARRENSLVTLVRHPDASPGFLSVLANHQDEMIASSARMHVNLAGELEDDTWEQAAGQAAQAVPLRNGGRHVSAIIELGGVPPWLATLLILHGDAEVRRCLARAAGTPRAVLASFRRAGARVDLLGYGEPDPLLTPAQLEFLRAGSPWSRGLAARHPSTSPAVLAQLAHDHAVEPRALAAHNPGLPSSSLFELANDSNARVRAAVARNEHAALALLERLAQDANPYVRRMATRNPAASPEVLAARAQDPQWLVRREVACHLATPNDTIHLLAGDPEPMVRYAIARRETLPPDLRRRLAVDDDPIIRAILQRRAAMPNRGILHRKRHRRGNAPIPPGGEPGLAGALSGSAANKQLLTALLALLDDYASGPLDRAVALVNPSLPAARMSAYLRAPHWLERCAIARNPQAPKGLVCLLIDDTNRVVRAAARARLATVSNGGDQ